ncbi:hypothetical protein ACS0TY_023452 [Phlomoides rotata]
MLLKGMEFDTAHFITDVSGKYPRLWALKGAHPVTVNRWYKFGVLASIRTIAPGFREISELPDWVVIYLNARRNDHFIIDDPAGQIYTLNRTEIRQPRT